MVRLLTNVLTAEGLDLIMLHDVSHAHLMLTMTVQRPLVASLGVHAIGDLGVHPGTALLAITRRHQTRVTYPGSRTTEDKSDAGPRRPTWDGKNSNRWLIRQIPQFYV